MICRLLTVSFLALCAVAGCAHRSAPSPMKGEPIRSSQKLRIGVLDYGTGFDRSGIDSCGEQFSAVQVVSEASLVSILRDANLTPMQLLEWGNKFQPFQAIPQMQLLLLVFQQGGKTYLRAVNYFSRAVSTVLLDLASPRCEDILRAQRLLLVESHPPIADVAVDGRAIGEAPVWTWLRDGNYQIKCALPEQKFKPLSVNIPRDVRVVCQRENSQSSASAVDSDEAATAEEKAGSILVYLAGAAASVAAILVPVLIFF